MLWMGHMVRHHILSDETVVLFSYVGAIGTLRDGHGAAPYFERRDGGAVFIVGAIGTLRDGQGEPLNYGAHARPAQPAPRARRGWVRSQPWWCAGKRLF